MSIGLVNALSENYHSTVAVALPREIRIIGAVDPTPSSFPLLYAVMLLHYAVSHFNRWDGQQRDWLDARGSFSQYRNGRQRCRTVRKTLTEAAAVMPGHRK
jgi:hypothetical protein